MAVKAYGDDISLIAGVDLSAAQYRIARITGNRTIGLATAATNDLLGVTQDKVALGQIMNVRVSGITKIAYGATVAAGAYLTSDANGRAITATTGRHIIGQAIVGGAANDIGEMLLTTRALFP